MSYIEFRDNILSELKEENYLIDFESPLIKQLSHFANPELPDSDLIRIKRLKKEELRTFKTLLFTSVIQKAQTRLVLEFAAAIKEQLVDPEPSDLYLFIFFEREGYQPSLDECIRIEATEEFCRKYVKRPNEDIEAFIQRTFIKSKIGESSDESLDDPLFKVLQNMSEKYPWFTGELKQTWKSALISGSGGRRVADLVFNNHEKDTLD